MVKNPPANAGDIRDAGLISASGKSPGERNGHPLHYSCLENPMDRTAWQATVHGIAESDTNDLAYTHKKEYTMHWQIYLELQSSKRNRSLICLLPGRWLYFQNKVLDLSHVTTEL